MIIEDSLIATHAFASHLPKSLSHVASCYTDSAAWKISHGKGGVGEKGLFPWQETGPDLCRYNASDAKLTALVWQRLQVDLDRERDVYEVDKRLALVCLRMFQTGIGVDIARKRELEALAAARGEELQESMRNTLNDHSFTPSKLGDVRRALFSTLGATTEVKTASGIPSTANATLELYRSGDTELGRFADALLRWRLVMKVKSTYLEAVEIDPRDGRSHPSWKSFGTVSGRLSSRFQSVPKWSPLEVASRVREIYIPRKGNVFVYFDVSQAEMRIAAYLAADPVFMAACGKDLHAGNARVIFPEIAAKGYLDGAAIKDPKRGKPFRDISKGVGFAISYGAGTDTVYLSLRSKGFDVTYKAVDLILMRLRKAYRVYYSYVEKNLERVREVGYMRTPILGRIRWLGWFPKPTDVGNYPVQSCLADIMNMRMIALQDMLPKDCRICLQIHDSLIVDTPKNKASMVEDLIRGMWEEPVPLPGGPLVLPIDQKRGERLSEL